MLEVFIPVLANSSDLAFAGLASSGFVDSWVTAGVCPKSTFWAAATPLTDPRFWLGSTTSPAAPPPCCTAPPWSLLGVGWGWVFGWVSKVVGPVYSGTSLTAGRFWDKILKASSKSSKRDFNPPR